MSFNTSSIFDNLNLKSAVSDLSQDMNTKLADVKGSLLNPVSSTTASIKDGIALLSSVDSKIKSTISNFKTDVLGMADGTINQLQSAYFTVNQLINAVTAAYSTLTSLGTLNRDLKNILKIETNGVTGFMDKFSNLFVSAINSKIRSSGYVTGTTSNKGEFLTITQNDNTDKTAALTAVLSKMSVGDLADSYNTAMATAVYATFLNQATASGLTSSYADLYAKLAVIDPSEADKAVVEAIGSALSNGDLTSIEKLIALLTNSSAKLTIGSTYPDAAETLLSNFKLLSTEGVGDYTSLNTRLKTILVLLGGVNWWKIYTSEGWVPNLLLGSKLTGVLRDIWMEDEELFCLVAVKGFFKELTARRAFLNNFPQCPIS